MVQQEIPGLGVKHEGDAHVDHQGALENTKWEFWLHPAPGLEVTCSPSLPGAPGSKGRLCWAGGPSHLEA